MNPYQITMMLFTKRECNFNKSILVFFFFWKKKNSVFSFGIQNTLQLSTQKYFITTFFFYYLKRKKI